MALRRTDDTIVRYAFSGELLQQERCISEGHQAGLNWLDQMINWDCATKRWSDSAKVIIYGYEYCHLTCPQRTVLARAEKDTSY